MRIFRLTYLSLLGCVLAQTPAVQAAPLGTAFTYQGRVRQSGSALNAAADFQFTLWDASAAGNMLGALVAANNVMIEDGLFTVELDFGALAFNGEARWLEIAIRSPAGGGAFTTLVPRQRLAPTPHALALPGLYTQSASVPNLIGGLSSNMVTTGVIGATIGGGGASLFANQVTDNHGTVGGGLGNRAGNNSGTTSDALNATVAGGSNNTASGARSTVGGGLSNTASGNNATVGGGNGNLASGLEATVPGGNNNTAEGSWSFAAGRRAKANHQGAFVWADSTFADFASTANNQFLIRAGGGVGIGTAAPGARLDVLHSASTGAAAHITIDNALNIAAATLEVSNDGQGYGIDVSAVLGGLRATADGGDSAGIIGLGRAMGVSGTATFSASPSPTWGGFFQNASIEGGGVFGSAGNPNGTGAGVHGVSFSGSGVGVYGENNTNGEQAFGVKGEITHATGVGAGVWGKAPFYGVVGEATGAGIGVSGIALNGGDGVVGQSSTGWGVNGFTSSSNTNLAGVRGGGPVAGVRGVATNSSGVTYAVFGTTLSAAGYGGYFEGRGHFSGNVGIGVAPPANRLDVRDDSLTANIMNLQRNGDSASSSDMLQVIMPTASSDTSQFIECERGSDVKFRVWGDGDVTADGTYTSPADFAEMFRVTSGADSVEPGDVLVIDATNPRAVVKSTSPRSTLVAGVYSTKPGVLGSEHDWDQVAHDLGFAADENGEARAMKPKELGRMIDEVPMAVVGVVPCKVSAENGPIRPGDLLVTSGTPGHAMRDEQPGTGTVVGKALDVLESGTGIIRVLVTLH